LEKEITELKKQGLDIIALPCNSAASIVNRLKSRIKINIPNIQQAAIEWLVETNIKEIALICTRATLNMGYYESHFEINGIRVHKPDKSLQDKIDDLIKHVASGHAVYKYRNNLYQIIQNIKITYGVNNIFLACTDLGGILEEQEGIHDSLKIYAKKISEELKKT